MQKNVPSYLLRFLLDRGGWPKKKLPECNFQENISNEVLCVTQPAHVMQRVFSSSIFLIIFYSCYYCSNWNLIFFKFPDAIKTLPPVTQFYTSIDAATQAELKAIDRPLHRDFWERFQKSLQYMNVSFSINTFY
jgi:hypothetical protein